MFSKVYKPKYLFRTLPIFIFGAFLIVSFSAYADNIKDENKTQPNSETIRLYEDCKVYLSDSMGSGHFCPIAIDISLQSYVAGQGFILGILDENQQNAIDVAFKRYMTEVAHCKPQDDPVLSYDGGKKIKEVSAKFVHDIESHPGWLQLTPSQAFQNSFFSFSCNK